LNLSSWDWIVWLFAIPAVVGFIPTCFSDNIRELLGRMRLILVHPVPSVWDWKFHSTSDQWVLVTLTDNSQVAGYVGAESLISSAPSERDTCLQNVAEFNSQTAKWEETGSGGLPIASVR